MGRGEHNPGSHSQRRPNLKGGRHLVSEELGGSSSEQKLPLSLDEEGLRVRHSPKGTGVSGRVTRA